MRHLPIDQSLKVAVAHHQAGRFADAESIYRQVLAVQPNHPEALYLLGVLAGQGGRHADAIGLIQQAIDSNPSNPVYHRDLGVMLQSQGRLDETIACYQQALALKDDLADVHYNLGITWTLKSEPDKAVACFQRALDVRPNFTEAHYNLAMAWKNKGQLELAVTSFQRALDLKPDFVDAHNNLGMAWTRLGKFDKATASFQRALAINPDLAEVQCNLGLAMKDAGQLDQAIACYERALTIKPDFAEAHFNLANAWKDKGQLDDAIAGYQRAIAVKPQYAQAHINLGIAWNDSGRHDWAITSYQRALELTGENAAAYSNLAIALKDSGKVDQAAASCESALALKGDFVHAYNNLGNIQKERGLLDEAVACYRRALAVDPKFISAHDNLLTVLNYHPDSDSRRLLDEVRAWNHEHAQPLRRFILPKSINRDPDRRLRIGYVSSDFHDHASAFFLLPLFRSHDRRQFDLFCYAQVLHPDAITRQMQDHVPQWRNTVGRDNADVAALVREDQIDILIDLKLHTSDNRLLVFAHKPAPVQVTWLGYPGTTGMDTIDYRLTDPYLDPPGCDESFYCERSIRLPDTFWCYDPLSDEPRINALPCVKNGFITFGCLNNFCKVNDAVISLWAKVLHAVPGSRLILLAPEGTSRQRVFDRFHNDSIAPDRIEFVGTLSRPAYMQTYRRIDIALDTFPYNGHTTSLDSFWMGVPVITLVGKTVVGRAGFSELSNLRLSELIARSPQHYVQIAADLAADRPRVAELRATLRQRMENSPLMDAGRFARNIEAAYRTMWRTWCDA